MKIFDNAKTGFGAYDVCIERVIVITAVHSDQQSTSLVTPNGCVTFSQIMETVRVLVEV